MKIIESKLFFSASPIGKINIVGRYSSFIKRDWVLSNLDFGNLLHDSFYY